MLIAPSEPKSIQILGRRSSLPEKRGADIMFPAHGTLVGVQRKEISDLIASLHDGRLGKEIAQMQSGLGIGALVVEGRLKWTNDGVLIKDFGAEYTRTAHRNLLRSVQARGVWVESTDDAADTVTCVLELQAYLNKKSHSGLLKRPGPASPWGTVTNQDWCAHFLQGLDGVGPEMAQRILGHFGGLPLKWTVDVGELQQVAGIGKKTAEKLVNALAQ